MHSKTIFISLFFCTFAYGTAISLLEPVIENVVHLQTALPPPDAPGVWRKKLIWKARWVKEWKAAKTWRPVWRKVWSPVEIREWVPIPKPPPNFHDESHDDSPPVIDQPSPVYGPSNPTDFPGPTPPGPHGPPQGPLSGQRPPQGPPPGLVQRPSGVYGPPQTPPQGPPPFRPMGPPSIAYGPPNAQNVGPSTPLHPVADSPPGSWPVPDMQELLTSYHTIRDPEAELQKSNYHIDSPNPEKQLSRFFEPPSKQQEEFYRSPSNTSSPLLGEASNSQDSKKSVSPYAAKLAQAVLREKFNKSLNPTDRPSGLTDVIYKPNESSTPSSRVSKAVGVTSTENPNVYIVTPLSLG